MPNVIDSLDDLRHLFELMGNYGIGIVELPGGFKVVREPDVKQPNAVRGEAVRDAPRPSRMDEDPMLYSDGIVPSFDS